MYETGEEYFQWRCNGWTKILNEFRKSKEMWNWWKVQYAIIDEQIVLSKLDYDFNLYRTHHLGLEYGPDTAIVRRVLSSFEKAVQNEIKSIKNEIQNEVNCEK